MSASNTAEINFTDSTQLVVPIKDNDDHDICYITGESIIVYEVWQETYTVYPMHTIKNVKFTP